MGYREFSGTLDGQGTTYVEFDGELDDAARRPLPAWTAPSKAGAGRGFVNPSAVEPPGLLDRVASTARDVIQAGEAATPVRGRGGVRGEFKPFVGGDERIDRAATVDDGITPDPLARPAAERPDELAQWQVDAEFLSQSPQSQRQEQAARIHQGRIANAPTMGPGPAPRGVDVAADAVRDALDAGGSRTLAGRAAGKGTQMAGDLALSTIRIVPETLQLANDILQLGTGGLTQGFSRVMEATSNVIGEQQSTKLAGEHAELMNIMRDPDAGPSEVAGFLLTHPEYSLNAALPSVGSMAIGAGGGRLGAQFAKALAARRGAVGAEIAAAIDRGAAVGATAANAAMNAGSTFDQTRGDLSDKYLAAGIAGAGTAAAGKFFDGGAEAMLARRAVAASRPSAIAGTAIKEAGQEGFESLSQGIGQAAGEGRPLDPDALAKQATLEGALGGIIGGAAGVSLPVADQEQTAEQLARAKGFLRPVERAQAIDRRVDDFAVEYGVLPKAIAAVKAEGARRSLAERVPYYKRAMAALAKHGLVSRQLDDAALTMLDESGEDAMGSDARGAFNGGATVDTGRFPGGGAEPLQERPISLANQRGSGGAQISAPGEEVRSAPVSTPAVSTPVSIEQQLADRLAEQFGIGAEATDEDATAAPAPDEAGRAGDAAALTQIDQAAHEAATSPTNDRPEPTDAQKESGNYKVGRVRIDGMNVSIENPKGSIRRSKADAAAPWEVEMPAHYGYIRGTNGADGDHVDLFIGDRGENGRYWVINQNQPDSRTFDEHKVVTGVDSAEAAVELYKRSFADGFGDKVFASVSGEFDADGIKAKLPEMSKARAVKGGTTTSATPEPAPVLADASKPSPVIKRQGALVETWTGTQKKGMLIHAAQSQLRDQQKRHPDLQWSIVPAPEFAEDRFKLEGRAPVAEFETGERITIDGEPATVAKVAKAHIVAQTDAGKKRIVAFDSPTMERIRAARQAATTPAAAPIAAGVAPARKSTPAGRTRRAFQLDAERDTVLQAIAKMGGIRREALAKEFGMKPEEMKHTVMVGSLKSYPFRKEGMPIDRALEALVEAGYFRGIDPADQMRALEGAIFDEMGGNATRTTEGQMRQAEEQAADEAQRAALDDMTPDDLEESGYADASPEVQEATRRLLADAEQAGIDTEAMKEDAARDSEASEDQYHARLQDAIRQALQALAQDRAGAAAADAAAEGRGSQGGEQAAGDQGAQGGERAGLTRRDTTAAVPAFDNAAGRFNPDLDPYWIKKGKEEIGDSASDLSDAEYNTAVAEYANQWRIDGLLEQLGYKSRGVSGQSSSRYFERFIEGDDPADNKTFEVRLADHDDRHPASADIDRRFQVNFRDGGRWGADLDITPEMSSADALAALRELLPNEPSAPTSSGADSLLTAQSPSDLKAKTERESSAKAADSAEQKRLADKAKADAEAGEFALTGSDRAADVAAAGGQQDLLERAPIAASGAVGNFGQELPPSRRQRRSMLDEALSADDIRAKPLSEIWPAAENDAIEDKFAAAVAHAAREEIPAKPRKGYKLDRWIDKVQTLRDMAQRVVSGEVSRERFMDRSRDYRIGEFISKVTLLEAIDRAQWKRIGRVQEHPNAYTYVDGKQTPAPQVLVEIDNRARRFEGSGSLADHLEAINELLGTPLADKRMQFEIRTDRKGRYFINKKGDSEYRELMQFDSAEAARTAMRERYDDLVAAWEAVKERDNVTERDLRSAENRDRVGEDWRQGRDITGDEFIERFGFVGGEFGGWVEQGKGAKERQWMLNRAYDALMDLAQIVGVPPRALSLNGSLGLAFGARGSGWASAHFEPDTLVINLTKTRGAGSLAHEWFHALDNYFSRLRGGEVKTSTAADYRRQNFVTYKPEPLMVRKDGRGTAVTKTRLEEWRAANANSADLAADKWQPDPKHPQGVRPQVEERFAELVKALDAAPFTKRSRAIDHVKDSGEGYWSQVLERAARSFESYVIDKMMQQGHHNDYLANVTPLEKFRRDPSRYPYPTPAEIAPIAEAFDDLFGTLETRDGDDGNVVLFSRSGQSVQLLEGERLADTAVADEVEKRIGEFAHQPPIQIRDQAAGTIPGATAADAISGAVYRGRIYLFRDRLGSRLDVQRTLFHELFHYGLRRFLTREQYVTELTRLAGRDADIRREAERWARTDEGRRAADHGGEDYALARGVDEALATLAEPNAGAYLRTSIGQRMVRAVTRWAADLADAFGFKNVAAELRAYKSEEAREFVQSIFRRLEQDAAPTSDAWGFTADAAFSQERKAEGEPAAARLELPTESPARWLQRKTQDSLNRFNVVRDWAIEHGVDMTPDSNVWAFEERMHGRVATRVEDFRERRLKPLVKAVQSAGFTMDEVAEFLHAQHAAERNRQVAKIDPQSTAGSGITDEEATRILGSADPKLAALANDVRSITDDTRRILLESGIISTEMADAWQAAYQHYVPLKGDLQAKTGTGKGLSVNGRQNRALGHGQRDEHIVENILRDHERAILLAEKNTVGHALLAFVAELSNDDIATVGKPVKRKALVHGTVYEVTTENGSGVATFDSLEAANAYMRSHPGQPLTAHAVKADPQVAYLASSALADNEVQVYVKGHAIRVQLNDPLLANAYRAIGVERLNRLLALNRQVNTWLSKAYTGLNPEFLLVNISRDFSTGVINIVANYGAGVAAKAIASYPKAFASVLRYSFGGEATPMLRAYRDAGGSTGAAYLSDLERVGLDVKNAYDDYQGVVATMKDGRPTDALAVASRKLLGTFTGWVEHLNAAGENAMRLAVFDGLLSTSGYTVNDAASAAKNATVNFNRKGEWGQVLNSMYLFYNANVQGTAALADALAHGKHRGQAWTLLAMLPAAAYALAAAQFDDDEWRRIPDYIKSRNVIIRTGAKTYATLPIPYGYGWFWSLGYAIFDLRQGRDLDKVALNIANGLLENFSPVNPLGDDPDPRGLVELLPGAVGGELMRAAARLAVNRSGLGRDIVPDSKFDENRPDSLRMWRSTKGTLSDKAAGTLNRWTGGTKTQSGAIDVSPETLRYWASTLTGGAGTFVSDTMGLAGLGLRYAATADPKEAAALTPELREIPVVRKFVRQDDIRDARAAYWSAVKEANDAVADFERARKADDAPGKAATREKANLLKPMVRMSQAMNKEIKARRDRVETIMADDSVSLARKRIALRVVEAEEQRLYDKYVSAFDAKVRRLNAQKTAKTPAMVPAE